MRNRPVLVIGSRGSRLALTQTGFVQAEIRRMVPEIEIRVEIIKTSADKNIEASLRESGAGTGVFVKELENALSREEIDIAVHSMKDVPTTIMEGLRIAAVPAREDARDALISNLCIPDTPQGEFTLFSLPMGARVGTGSFRRQAQLLALRPDLRIMDIRGNIDTRVMKVKNGEYDVVALAVAGLRRLGMQNQISCTLSYEEMLPAPGQGALAVEVRADDVYVNEIAKTLNHHPTALAVAVERDFLERMGGGCNVPIAVYARIRDGVLKIDALVAQPDGKHVVRGKTSGDPEKSANVCSALAERVLTAGGREILREFRR